MKAIATTDTDQGVITADTIHHNVPGDCWYCHGGCSVCTPDKD